MQIKMQRDIINSVFPTVFKLRIVTLYETRSVLILAQLARRRYGSTAGERPRTGVTFSELSVVV